VAQVDEAILRSEDQRTDDGPVESEWKKPRIRAAGAFRSPPKGEAGFSGLDLKSYCESKTWRIEDLAPENIGILVEKCLFHAMPNALDITALDGGSRTAPSNRPSAERSPVKSRHGSNPARLRIRLDTVHRFLRDSRRTESATGQRPPCLARADGELEAGEKKRA